MIKRKWETGGRKPQGRHQRRQSVLDEQIRKEEMHRREREWADRMIKKRKKNDADMLKILDIDKKQAELTGDFVEFLFDNLVTGIRR